MQYKVKNGGVCNQNKTCICKQEFYGDTLNGHFSRPKNCTNKLAETTFEQRAFGSEETFNFLVLAGGDGWRGMQNVPEDWKGRKGKQRRKASLGTESIPTSS
jgi:hypothetical protein